MATFNLRAAVRQPLRTDAETGTSGIDASIALSDALACGEGWYEGSCAAPRYAGAAKMKMPIKVGLSKQLLRDARLRQVQGCIRLQRLL